MGAKWVSIDVGCDAPRPRGRGLDGVVAAGSGPMRAVRGSESEEEGEGGGEG